MVKRVLVYFKNEKCTDILLKFLESFSKKYNCQIDGIYIKDIRKHDIIPAAAEGMFVDFSTNYILKEWEKYEEDLSKKLKDKYNESYPESNFIIDEGSSVDIIREKMKGYDLLLMSKAENLDEIIKSILRTHSKPILMIPKQEKYEFNNVLFADDDEEDANTSIFKFLSLFEGIDNYTGITVGLDTEHKALKEYFDCIEKSIEFKNEKCNNCNAITTELEKHDILIMGNLQHSFIYEKLTGKYGIKILNKAEKPIFIG
jgi:hypothetical protein